MADEKEILQFPCLIPLKAVGSQPEDFEIFVLEIVRKHVVEVIADDVTRRASGGGKYLAVTVPFIADSREQLEAIYRELSSHERVKFLI